MTEDEKRAKEFESNQYIKTRWEVIPMRSRKTGMIHLGIAPRFHMLPMPFPEKPRFPKWDDSEQPKSF